MYLTHLKDLRQARKLRQADMAEMLQIDRTTYAKYESGASEPPLLTIVQLAGYFGVSVDYILGINTVKLPEDEAELLKIYRQLTPSGRAIILATAEATLRQADMRQDSTTPSAM